MEDTQVIKYDIEEAVLNELEEKYKGITIIPGDKDSYAMVMSAIRSYREIRLKVVDWHKEKKAGILKVGRAIDAEKNRVLDIVLPKENHFKDMRQAEDDRIKEIEKKRVDNIRVKINDIRSLDYGVSKLSLDEMKEAKHRLENTPITEEDYQEFVGDAMAAVHNVLIGINSAIDNRERLDKEEAERKAEEDRLEKIRKEQAEAQAKIDEANRKAEEDQAKLDEEKRKIQADKDALEKKLKDELERREREELEKKIREEERVKAEKEAQEKAERDKQERIERENAEQAEKERQEALRPDKDKLIHIANDLAAFVSKPHGLTDKKAIALFSSFEQYIFKGTDGLITRAKEL